MQNVQLKDKELLRKNAMTIGLNSSSSKEILQVHEQDFAKITDILSGLSFELPDPKEFDFMCRELNRKFPNFNPRFIENSAYSQKSALITFVAFGEEQEAGNFADIYPQNISYSEFLNREIKTKKITQVADLPLVFSGKMDDQGLKKKVIACGLLSMIQSRIDHRSAQHQEMQFEEYKQSSSFKMPHIKSPSTKSHKKSKKVDHYEAGKDSKDQMQKQMDEYNQAMYEAERQKQQAYKVRKKKKKKKMSLMKKAFIGAGAFGGGLGILASNMDGFVNQAPSQEVLNPLGYIIHTLIC
ncbi:MAG: hypothetical protein N4A36_01005 [Candidatus Gracilibacteria bacterium]|nr:hypothetical protein [Candidatus Gracilibacteria bacterium]